MSNSERAPKVEKAYYVGLHRYHFQAGTPAEILGVAIVTPNGNSRPRPCYHLRYPDGLEDYAPLSDEDFVGKGGLGTLYAIISEAQVHSGDIPAIAA